MERDIYYRFKVETYLAAMFVAGELEALGDRRWMDTLSRLRAKRSSPLRALPVFCRWGDGR